MQPISTQREFRSTERSGRGLRLRAMFGSMGSAALIQMRLWESSTVSSNVRSLACGQGQNKILFQRMLSAPEQPDFFLVVVKACEVGTSRCRITGVEVGRHAADFIQ